MKVPIRISIAFAMSSVLTLIFGTGAGFGQLPAADRQLPKPPTYSPAPVPASTPAPVTAASAASPAIAAPGWQNASPSAAPAVYASAPAPAQPLAAPANGLLDGLALENPAAAGMNGQPPADRKAVQGVLGLHYGGVSCVMSRCSKTSKMAQGTVVLRSGEKLEGEFACKIQQGKKDPQYHLAEIQFRNGRDDKKQKIPADSVWDFIVKFNIDDYMSARPNNRDGTQGFSEVVLKLNDGTEKRGLGAMSSEGTGGFREVIYAPDRTTNVEVYDASSVRSVVKPNVGEWVAYNGGLQSARRGKNFLYFRNPQSTTRATGFRAGLANAGAGFGASVLSAANAAAETSQLNTEMQKRVDRGENALNVLREGQQRAATIEARNDNMARELGKDLALTKPEYVFRNVRTGYEVLFSEDTIEEKLGQLLAACKTTSRMDKGQRKDLLRLKNLDRLFETVDGCF